jgi:hypothetical protein
MPNLSSQLSLYNLTLPFILVLGIPLAWLAVVTTTISLIVLQLRVSFVHLEIGIALAPYNVKRVLDIIQIDILRTKTRPPRANKPDFNWDTPIQTPPANLPRRARRYSSASATGLTPAHSAISLPLAQSIGPTRDFEGVGGWRLTPGVDDDEEDAWLRINSRLELPSESPRRHHKRSSTGGSFTGLGLAPQKLDITAAHFANAQSGAASPNMRRARQGSTTTLFGSEGYFAYAATGYGGKSGATTPSHVPRSAVDAAQRLSMASESTNSSKSSGLTMKPPG